MRTALLSPLTDKLERDWDRDLFGAKGLAPMLGWDSFWTFRSKGSRAGFPDRTIVRERIVYAELKRELTGKRSEDANRQPSEYQIEWLDKLARAGGECYLWRPSDLDEIARVLGKPWHLLANDKYRVLSDNGSTGSIFRPASIWIPGRGRADTITDALKGAA